MTRCLVSDLLLTYMYLTYLTFTIPLVECFFFFKPFWYLYAVYLRLFKMRLLPHEIFYNLEPSDFSQVLILPFLTR